MEPSKETPTTEEKLTYLDQVFDRKANLVILVLVGAGAIAGIFLKDEGRWFIWGTDLAVLAVFFLEPWFSKEKRQQRGL